MISWLIRRNSIPPGGLSLTILQKKDFIWRLIQKIYRLIPLSKRRSELCWLLACISSKAKTVTASSSNDDNSNSSSTHYLTIREDNDFSIYKNATGQRHQRMWQNYLDFYPVPRILKLEVPLSTKWVSGRARRSWHLS